MFLNHGFYGLWDFTDVRLFGFWGAYILGFESGFTGFRGLLYGRMAFARP
jgi:hypothetical protein